MEHVQIKLDLTLQEVNVLLEMMGKQPTSTGVYPLLIKTRMQAEACIERERARKPKEPRDAKT